jgi:hypothetical protein
MSSLKQVDANRRNALKSTGPTTPEGKERSRRNAVRHGLTAETVIASLEDINDYQAFEAAVTADYAPETAVERELVLRLASVLWRLRRATSIDTGLFESVTAEPNKSEPRHPHLGLVGPTDVPQQNQTFVRATPQSDAAATNERRLDSERNIVDGFLRLTTLPTFPLDRLIRYEYTLWRQARQQIFTLDSFGRRKQPRIRSNFQIPFRSGNSDEFE